MSGVNHLRTWLGQAHGPDVELVVTGTAEYTEYETIDGYPAVYDDARGLFCYARVTAGRYESTGVPVSSNPPDGVERHAKESEAVRAARIADRRHHMERRAGGPPGERNR